MNETQEKAFIHRTTKNVRLIKKNKTYLGIDSPIHKVMGTIHEHLMHRSRFFLKIILHLQIKLKDCYNVTKYKPAREQATSLALLFE